MVLNKVISNSAVRGSVASFTTKQFPDRVVNPSVAVLTLSGFCISIFGLQQLDNASKRNKSKPIMKHCQ
ncbi:hypothetical protein NH340_JMT03922 [Sarcoptes scabiei]|uniref:Uncharacterized protein n=1 Tax=Sarcoptes scabiei TaxID=52283 RepID=A0A131ZZT9_SARSC|nr:hypothetical protein QR98_0024680 [Sarcoptes scabiei]UXI17979.1 hypothetical protein NH340_JMT03922 [Sarcoptes scabiei]